MIDIKTKIVDTLNTICCENSNKKNQYEMECFRCLHNPDVNLCEYLNRIFAYISFEKSTLELLLIYTYRLNTKYYIKFENVHRIILLLCIIARKYNEDFHFTNAYYAEAGGLSTKELLLLEMYTCKLLDYRLYVYGIDN